MTVNLSLDKGLILKSGLKPAHSYAEGSNFIHIYGDFAGIITDKAYDSRTGFDLFKKAANLPAVEKLMRSSLGAFYLVLKDKSGIYLLASASSPGIFYTKTDESIYFSTDEDDIFKKFGRRENIDELHLLNCVASNSLAIRLPFTTIFKNIFRVPCGGFVKIKSDFDAENGIFILKNSDEVEKTVRGLSFKEDLRRFSFLIENSLKLIVDYNRNNEIALSKSGGIDSAVLLAALKKANINFVPYHIPFNGEYDLTTKLAKIVTGFSGYQLSITKVKEPNTTSLGERAKFGLGMIHGPLHMQFNHKDYEADHQRPVISINGQNADSVYFMDTFAPCSIFIGLQRLIPILKTVRKRVYYNGLFLRKKRPFWIRFWPFSVGRDKLHAIFADYLVSTSLPVNEHVVPLDQKLKSSLPPQIDAKLRELRMEFFYKPLISIANKKYGIDVNKSDPDFKIKNHVLRVFRWFRTMQNAPVNFYNTGRYENIKRVLPYSEGPISDFFLNYMLGFKDMFFIKRLSFAYFESVIGKPHAYFVRKLYPNFLFRIIRLPYLILKRLIKGEPESHAKKQLAFTINILKKMTTPSEKYVCHFCKDKDIADYIASLYEKFEYEPAKVSKFDVMELCRLINLEVLLKELGI